MRVGLVVYGSLETRTGGYLYDRILLDHLDAQGDQTEVVSLPPRRYARHLCDNLSPSFIRRLAGAELDVLLEDELNHPSLALLNARLKKYARYPIVTIVHLLRTSEHAGSRLRPLYAATERRFLATVDAAVFNCETTRAGAEDLLGRKLPGIVAYPACDHLSPEASSSDVAARAREPGPLRVLSLANVLPGKGLHVLLDALGKLPGGGWHLTVVGSLSMDRAYSSHIRAVISRAGLADRVELVGSVDNALIPKYLARSHLLAIPSSYEAIGIAYLEAMRFGLPVIATAAGGAREIVEDGREGFLIDPNDVDALAGCLRMLATDRELLVWMGLAARSRMQRHPTWNQSFSRVRALLCSLIDDRRGQGVQGKAP